MSKAKKLIGKMTEGNGSFSSDDVGKTFTVKNDVYLIRDTDCDRYVMQGVSGVMFTNFKDVKEFKLLSKGKYTITDYYVPYVICKGPGGEDEYEASMLDAMLDYGYIKM